MKDPAADVDPMSLTKKINWSEVGGLAAHVNALKEMVMLPLLYPELFERFHVSPPKGVLFYGPPGTGKTLTARALASTCSAAGKEVKFFMRKGADCLSKWVGEAERQLRLLFERVSVCDICVCVWCLLLSHGISCAFMVFSYCLIVSPPFSLYFGFVF